MFNESNSSSSGYVAGTDDTELCTVSKDEQHSVEDSSRTTTISDFNDFLHRAAAGEMHPVRTGCAAIDNHLRGGIRDELTILMAEPGAGKTTLCMSMFPYFAAAQRDVLFISLDLPKKHVMGKIASRLSYYLEDERGPLEFYDVYNLKNNDTDYINKLVAAYAAEASYTTICDRSTINKLSDIEDEIEQLCLSVDKPPVVIIDYVQVLATLHESAAERDAVERTIGFCRELIARYHTPMILISSIARTAYGKKLTLSSAKESGSLEYAADCMIGLQRDLEVENNYCSDERPIKLKFFKTRFSADKAEFPLRMLPQYNLFLFDDTVNTETSSKPKESDDDYVSL